MTDTAPLERPLAGKVAFITGAGRGVGFATARHLATRGAAVAVNDVSDDAATEAVARLSDGGADAFAAVADVTDLDAVGAAITATVEHFGGLDILVNNAGNVGTDPQGWTLDRFWESDPDRWHFVVDVNLYGVMHCCYHAIPHLIERGEGGRVISVVSDAARVGEPRLEVYAAAKAGANGFTRAIAHSLGRYGITANSVALGTMNAPVYEAMDPEDLAKRLSGYMIRRPGFDDEVAALIAHLAGPDGAWITGQTYPVNGGQSTS